MKIYTRTGDAGQTGLFGGARVMKNDPRVEAYGTIDELNAVLGVARASALSAVLEPTLLRLQDELFVLGAEVACEPGKLDRLKMKFLEQDSVEWMEQSIDEHESHLAPLTNFILAGGSPGAAHIHLARTVARRAERLCLSLGDLRPFIFVYLNRLSDFLFVLARRANQLENIEETPWLGRARGESPGPA
jgi:cob(I)alamin adenosyltransferase